MRRFRVAALALALAGSMALSGCEHGSFVYYAGVTVGPPAPRLVGPVGVSPGMGWVWTDGFYTWGPNAWVWQPGRWARPPRAGMRWQSPRYSRYRNGWRMYPGRWR